MMAQPSPDQDIAVLRVALDLAAVPSRRRQLLNSPLPEGVTFLLLIVTDDRSAIEASAKRMQSPRKSCVKRRRSTSNRSCWRRTPTAIACWGRGGAPQPRNCVEILRFFANGCIRSFAKIWHGQCFSCGSPAHGTMSRRRSGAVPMMRPWTLAWQRLASRATSKRATGKEMARPNL